MGVSITRMQIPLGLSPLIVSARLELETSSRLGIQYGQPSTVVVLAVILPLTFSDRRLSFEGLSDFHFLRSRSMSSTGPIHPVGCHRDHLHDAVMPGYWRCRWPKQEGERVQNCRLEGRGRPDCCREIEPSQVRRDQTILDAIQMPS